MERRTEKSSSSSSAAAEASKEEVSEKTAILYLYHPCHFLEEALRALFSCLGFEFGTNRDSNGKGEKNSLLKTPSHAEAEDPSTTEYTEEQESDPPLTTTTQSFQLSASSRRRSNLAEGSGPQTN